MINNYIRHTIVALFFLMSIGIGLTWAQSKNIDSLYGVHIIKKLASKAYKGRGYGLGGDRKAAHLIADEFRKMGVQPLSGYGYFHEFTLDANIFPNKVSVKLNHQKLRPGIDYLVWAGSPTIKGTFHLVHASRMQLYNNKSIDSLVHLAADKFLFIDNRTVNPETAEQKALIKEALLRLRNDPTLAIKGVVIFSKDKLTQTAQTEQGIRPVLLVNRADLAPAAMQEIEVNIVSRFLKDYVTQNVAAMVKGTTQPDSMLFITAHYDHIGVMGKKAIFHGANDNASGTAFMLSLAKYYAANPPRYSMVFVGFSGEESGLLGSQAFVENPPIDLSKIKFLINFDMVGTGEDGITVVNAPLFPRAFGILQQANETHHYLKQVKSRGESCNSDHCPFFQKGVPSFFIYTMGGIAAYHDVFDRAETLPLTEFADLKRLVIDFSEKL